MSTYFEQNYNELANNAAYRDLSMDRGRILITGSDAFPWLHALVSNDLRQLTVKPSTAVLAFCLDPTAHVLADLRVFKLEAGTFSERGGILIDTHASNTLALLDHLDRYVITEDVELRDVSQSTGCIAIQGPNAQNVPESSIWWDLDLTGFGGGVLMFSCLSDRDKWLQINTTLVPITDDTWQAARLECGLPEWGLELNSHVLAAEVDPYREQYSVSKGCYPGQEILARIDSRGHTNRQLYMVAARAGANLTCHTEVWARSPEAVSIGNLCSTVPSSPACNGRAIALALLRSNQITNGSSLFDETGDELTVVDIPRRRNTYQ